MLNLLEWFGVAGKRKGQPKLTLLVKHFVRLLRRIVDRVVRSFLLGLLWCGRSSCYTGEVGSTIGLRFSRLAANINRVRRLGRAGLDRPKDRIGRLGRVLGRQPAGILSAFRRRLTANRQGGLRPVSSPHSADGSPPIGRVGSGSSFHPNVFPSVSGDTNAVAIAFSTFVPLSSGLAMAGSR
jgi:hypothetical protein